MIQEDETSLKIEIQLSLACQQDLANFLSNSPRLKNKTKLHVAGATDNVNCYFENQMDMGRGDYEVINQQHPLIQFISAKSTEIDSNQHQLVATRIQANHFEQATQGIYLVLIQRWSTKSAKESESLIYKCLNLSTQI